jgi:hypothetical protein
MSYNHVSETKQTDASPLAGTEMITTYSQLVLQIALLRQDRETQEFILRDTFKNLFASSNLISLFRVATNQDRPMEFAKSGLTLVITLITNLILGKHRSFKGYLSALMIERFTTMLVDNNLLNIFEGITSLFSKKNNSSDNQE